MLSFLLIHFLKETKLAYVTKNVINIEIGEFKSIGLISSDACENQETTLYLEPLK